MDIEQQRIEAQNENTSPEILTQLATSEDYLTRKYVTANPNTPKQSLLRLGEEYPRELLNNPVFDLFIIEDMEFVKKMPLATLQSLLKQQDVPEFIIEQGCDRAELETQLQLANKITTSKKALETLSNSRYPEVAETAKLHINLAGEIIDGYENKAHQIITSGLKDKKSYHQLGYLQKLSFVCPIPDFVLEYLLDNSSTNEFDRIRQNMAKNPNVSLDTLALLAKDKNSQIRQNIASNPKTSIEILSQLVEDEDVQVRCEVVRNINTPKDILIALTKNKNIYVAQFASVKCTIQFYTDLENNLKDKIERIRWENPLSIKQEDNHLLVKDVKFTKIVNTEANYLNITNNTLYNLASQYPIFVAQYPQTPPEILTQLSQHQNGHVRFNVANHPNTPVSIVEKLIAKNRYDYFYDNYNLSLNFLFKQLIRDISVTQALAYKFSEYTRKSNTKDIKLKMDLSDFDTILDIFAEETTNSLDETLQRLIDDGGIGARIFLATRLDLPLKFVKQLAQIEELEVQAQIAINPNTPVEILEQLSQLEAYGIHLALAKNPNISFSILEKLASKPEIAKTHRQNFREVIMRHPLIFNNLEKIMDIWQGCGVSNLMISNLKLNQKGSEYIICSGYGDTYLKNNPDFLINNPDSLTVVLNHFLQDKFDKVRYLVLQHPQISPEILEEKSFSVFWLERYAVSQNPNISSKTLQKLSNDSNQLVRACAKQRLSAI